MEYVLWNTLDGIPATPETYENVSDAQQARHNFIDRFQPQGYYLSGNYDRVPYLELARFLEIRPVGWERVVFASELAPCECCGEPWCQLHEEHYADCECVGPTQDGYEYLEVEEVLYARRLEGEEDE